jgi:prevent-host-death family protein
MTDVPLAEAHERFRSLVQRMASTRERVTITEDGRAAAVLISPEELDDLDEARVVSEYLMRDPEGRERGIPHHEAMARLGLAHRAQA